jgi:hypothetical protein
MAVSTATLHAKAQAHEKRINDIAGAVGTLTTSLAPVESHATFLAGLSQMARVSDSNATLGQCAATLNLLVDRLISAGYMS